MTLAKLIKNSVGGGILIILTVASSLIGANPASAAKITWELYNVNFDDGGMATGTFEHDSDTGVYSNWNITVKGGNETAFPSFTYNPSSAPLFASSGVQLWIGTANDRLNLLFTQSLNSG